MGAGSLPPLTKLAPAQVLEGPQSRQTGPRFQGPPLWDLHPKLGCWGTLFPTPSAAAAAEKESGTPVSKEAETPTSGPTLVTTGHMTTTLAHVLAACRPTRGLSQPPPLSGPQFPR